MNQERCAFEAIADKYETPFLSIKNRGPVSELVLNPNYFPQLEQYSELFHMYGFDTPRVIKEFLEAVCGYCPLCVQEITRDGEGFRIKREQYGYKELDEPLYEKVQFRPAEGRERHQRVCIVDDEEMTANGLAQLLAADGFLTLGITVNRDVQPNLLAERQLLKDILAWRTDQLIADKGLGYVNGIDLIQGAKVAGVRTIMLTGEIQTDETRKVADIFLTKPQSSWQILYILTGDSSYLT